jgi:enoyl reductase-like protein
MNYVGSVSILDRGDEPAQAIIDKNKRSLAQRIADETKDELEKVMTRVEDVSVKGQRSRTLKTNNSNVNGDAGNIRPSIKNCMFAVTRPTHSKYSYPNFFMATLILIFFFKLRFEFINSA